MTTTDTVPMTEASAPARRAMNKNTMTPLQEKRSRSQARTPLQEMSSSEANIGTSALGRDKMDIYAANPFPTKPQHVLLPSTVRKQNSFQVQDSPYYVRKENDRARDVSSRNGRPGRTTPVVQLKKSVTTLRDMYEEQDKSSRPSTAASPYLRPTTSSSRLRSASSSDGLAGKYAWEKFHQISNDDMALLPSLNETMVKRMNSEQSFASRYGVPITSTPNYQIYSTSSPKLPIFRDNPGLSSESTEPSSSIEMSQVSMSSPNFVRLGRSSSLGEAGTSLPSSSSPNFVKLGTSSPGGRRTSSPTPSSSSQRSLKRKRVETREQSAPSVRAQIFNSSPPYVAHPTPSPEPSLLFSENRRLASSNSDRSQPSSSPVFRFGVRGHGVSDSSLPSSSAHVSLQAALSSSPIPPIQYPIVRAPRTLHQLITVPKRHQSHSEGAAYMSRLSEVPSEWDGTSQKSDGLEDLRRERIDSVSSEVEVPANESQIRIYIDDDHEATDELSALPRGGMYRPPMVPQRTNSLYGMSSSSSSQSQSRLNSLRRSMDSRLNSMKSSSLRPTSSSSATTSVVVPTWARRYYSGLYRDSFQQLYPPSQNNSSAQLAMPTQQQYQTYNYTRPYSHHRAPSTQLSSQISHSSRPSIQSVRRSLRDSIIEIMPHMLRPRIEARKSHLTAGMGPLVSNPVTQLPPAPPAHLNQHTPQRYTYTIRHISIPPQDPVDPRAHWNGVQDERYRDGDSLYDPHNPYQHRQHRSSDSGPGSTYHVPSHRSSLTTPRGGGGGFRFLPSPHLHHDRRLNTGSSTSRGYGFPFNQHPRFAPPPLETSTTRNPLAHLHSGTTQKLLFILGFLCPLTWFVASTISLPIRPLEYSDIEKDEWDAATNNGRRVLGEYEEMDVVARLRMERHVRGYEEMEWQKARWWRRLNRVMSIVGVVVVILVIILAVVGTRNNW